MHSIAVRADQPLLPSFLSRANKAQHEYIFHAARANELPRVYFHPRPGPNLFDVQPGSGVAISLCQHKEIARYARISAATYLLTAALLGITQYAVLEQNPILVPEDFRHDAPTRCLFGWSEAKQDHSLRFDEPFICPGCVQFYHCMGADRPLSALYELLRPSVWREDYVEDERVLLR